MVEKIIKVDFEPLGKRVEIKCGQTLLDAARQAGLPLTSDCGGAGSCGQCLVIARDQKMLSAPSLVEEGLLTEEQRAAGCRLACQTEAYADVKIDVPVASLITAQRLQVESQEVRPAPPGSPEDRVLKSYVVAVPEATLHDLRSDLKRVVDALVEKYGCPADLSASPAVVRTLSPLLRRHNWTVQALLRGSELIGFLHPEARAVGLAVDLGTTKVAAYLVDLCTGETLAAAGRPNPQIGYGEDVVSRLVYAMNHPGGEQTLAQAVYHTLEELSQTLAADAGVATTDIAEVCIVGNSAMTHLLLQLPVEQLALAPYVSAAGTPMELRAADVGLHFAPEARVYVPSLVAGYVGADLVAMTLASGIGADNRTVLGIDIGTNTEIVLAIRGQYRMVSLSCASGPAFEGAHIRAGMRAAAGAIERVHLNGDRPQVQTIDHVPAVGICGSGIIDAVAELRRIGAINDKGRFQRGQPRVRDGREGLEYLLVAAEDSATGEDITITQHDVDEIQFAKGAILAGITVLLEVSGLTFADLDEVVLAGAFGSYLNLDSAIALGLLPAVPLERYRQVGNAAGDGARRILVSQAARARAVEIAESIDYIELTVYKRFRRIYAKSMML